MKTLFPVLLVWLLNIHIAAQNRHADIIVKKPGDPFWEEKTFVIGDVTNSLLPFKKGDVIKVDRKNGLSHYRNKKLLNQYKIIPQSVTRKQDIVCRQPPCPPIITQRTIYFIGAWERFIDIGYNKLLISKNKYKDANAVTQVVNNFWIAACELKESATK
ncbi:hypothetical protein [Niabella hibiscisoli]|uniref:hypothetical protein n=1 Tax=Niabella hibiscisoli TaxID=1825928 RepID=UPI001F115AE5|nr:hypothetical protein [Niabella hibiscisoli]MCH5715230.1 hypothetical protein [Niabella hibiscisoli]